jgi:threonine/homoserine/homoserine lactone efflux protein
VAFATQFIGPEGSYLPQAALLVATFTCIAAATDTVYALAASGASGLVQGSRFRIWAQRSGGGALIAAGLATAAVRR